LGGKKKKKDRLGKKKTKKVRKRLFVGGRGKRFFPEKGEHFETVGRGEGGKKKGGGDCSRQGKVPGCIGNPKTGKAVDSTRGKGAPNVWKGKKPSPHEGGGFPSGPPVRRVGL